MNLLYYVDTIEGLMRADCSVQLIWKSLGLSVHVQRTVSLLNANAPRDVCVDLNIIRNHAEGVNNLRVLAEPDSV